MVEGTWGSHSHKEGPKKMSKHSIVCAGIDTGKNKLDVAISGSAKRWCFDNAAHGHAALSALLRQYHVERVGIEASGGYERAVVAELRRDGFVVIVFQPIQVRAYAQFHLQRAKNDDIDAGLIRACTAATEKIHAPPDPRLVQLADHQTLIDQITDDIAKLKNRRESCREACFRQFWEEQIADLKRKEKTALKQLVAAIRQHDDLARRLDLIASVDGVGLRTAVAILCPRSAGSHARRPPRSPGLHLMTTTAASATARGTSRAAASACAKPSTTPAWPQPITGTRNSSPSKTGSSPPASSTKSCASPAPGNC